MIFTIVIITLLRLLNIEPPPRPLCPDLDKKEGWWPESFSKSNETGHYTSNGTRIHEAILLNRDEFVERIVNRIKKREKHFFRFRIPMGELGIATVVWVDKEYKPMLHYPQNFETISLATMNVITESIDAKDLNWTCPNNSELCVMTKNQTQEMVDDITNKTDMSYEYICLQADYGMSHIVTDYSNNKSLSMLNSRNFAFPDLLYHFYFLKLLFVTYRPPFGLLPNSSFELDFPNYYCYNRANDCTIKELHIRYWIVVYLALALWLYVPLLIYYFPSQKPTETKAYFPAKYVTGMVPAYSSPVHFSRWLKQFFCYYTSPNQPNSSIYVRTRRFAFIVFIATFSFRFVFLCNFSSVVFVVVFAILLLFVFLSPTYISVYVQPEVPECFPLFCNSPYPSGLVSWNSVRDERREYQRLAFVMQERIFLVTYLRFWKYLWSCSFSSFSHMYSNVSFGMITVLEMLELLWKFLLAIVYFELSVFISIFYFATPYLFFIKEMTLAIFRAGKTVLHVSIILFGFLYAVATSFSICYIVTETLMFAYMGSSLSPSIAFHYVTLFISCGTAIYTMIHSLHDQYNTLLVMVIDILKDKDTFAIVCSRLTTVCPNSQLLLMKDNADNVYLHKVGEPPGSVYEMVLTKDCITSYIQRKYFLQILDYHLPIHRQVIFVVIKASLAVAFILLALSIKNVYHLNKEVKDIFGLASKIAISFLPAALQFVAYKNKFAHKQEMIKKRECVESIVTWIANLNP